MTMLSNVAKKFQGRLSREQIEEFKEAFDLFDDDRSGSISTTELGKVLGAMGHAPSEPEIKKMVAEIDTDGDGEISFEEFCEMMAKKQDEFGSTSFEEELREAFKVFDKDRDGYITHRELKNVLRQLGDNATDAEIQEMIDDVDSDNDGKISWQDFKDVMMG